MDETDQAFHDSQKPSWGPDGTLIYATAGEGGPLKGPTSARRSGSLLVQMDVLVSEGKDICFAKLATTSDVGLHLYCKVQRPDTDGLITAHPGDPREATKVDIDLYRRGSTLC